MEGLSKKRKHWACLSPKALSKNAEYCAEWRQRLALILLRTPSLYYVLYISIMSSAHKGESLELKRLLISLVSVNTGNFSISMTALINPFGSYVLSRERARRSSFYLERQRRENEESTLATYGQYMKLGFCKSVIMKCQNYLFFIAWLVGGLAQMPDPEKAKMYYFCFDLSSLGEICFCLVLAQWFPRDRPEK